MSEQRYGLRLCSNGSYYLYENNELVIDYICFDAFNRECAEELVKILNEQQATIKQLKKRINELEKQDIRYQVKINHLQKELDELTPMDLIGKAIANSVEHMNEIFVDFEKGE